MATAVLDDFYAAANTQDEEALRALFADDIVVWSNGTVMTGEDEVVGAIMTTAGLTMNRLAPVTVYVPGVPARSRSFFRAAVPAGTTSVQASVAYFDWAPRGSGG